MLLFLLRQLFHSVVVGEDADIKIIKIRLQVFGGADLIHVKPGLPAQAAVHGRGRISIPVGDIYVNTVRFPFGENVAQDLIQNLLSCHIAGQIHQLQREGLSGGIAFGAENPVFVLINPHGVIGDGPDFRFSAAVGEGDVPLMEAAGTISGESGIGRTAHGKIPFIFVRAGEWQIN